MSFSTKIRIGVLRGGPSPEYNVSLNTGKTILANLPEEFEPIDIFISKNGEWHVRGLQKSPYQILQSIDAAVNALHGAYGEDGTIQNLLDSFDIPYTGSKSLSSAFGMNKVIAKNVFIKADIKTPTHLIVEKDYEDDDFVGENKIIKTINENILLPVILKPISSGSSLGISLVKDARQLRESLKKSFAVSPKLLVEEFIAGKEATCGVIEGFRGEKIYKMMPVEVLREQGHFHDYDAKYVGLEPKYNVPGNFSSEEKEQIKNAAALVHEVLGLRHYSRSDFIVHPKRGLFCLEVNTLPELTHRSAFVKSLEAAGGNIKEFLAHLLKKVLKK